MPKSTNRSRSKQNSSDNADGPAPAGQASSVAVEIPYEYQQLKKFQAQALNNHDWRIRRSRQRYSQHNSSESTVRRHISLGRQWRRSDTPLVETNGGDTHAGDLEQANVSPCDTVRTESEIGHEGFDYFVSSTDQSSEGVCYEVVKHLYLNALMKNDQPLSLIQLAPHSIKNNASSSSTVVRVRSLRKGSELTDGILDNGQDEQLSAALHAADSTPRKVRMHLNSSGQSNVSTGSNLYHENFKIQKKHLENSSKFRRSSSQSPRPTHAPRARTASQIEKENAFQKMLQRLSTRFIPNHRAMVRGQRDSGYEENSGVATMQAPEVISDLRHPIHGVKRRMGIKSEPEKAQNSSSKSGHKKEDTADSGVHLEDGRKFKTLNPMAREFLSFIHNEGTHLLDSQTQSSKPLTLEAFTGNGGLVSPYLQEKPPLNNFNMEPAPPCGITPMDDSGTTLPVGMSNLFTSNEHSLFAGQFLNQRLAAEMVLPRAAGLVPQPVLQPIAGNILRIPATTLLNSALPLVGPIDPSIVAPSHPLPLMRTVVRPQPVPKPRRPDPGDQQAYEAWIEWRKANEPGYALECRLRQQRRAQRSPVDHASTLQQDNKSAVASAA